VTASEDLEDFMCAVVAVVIRVCKTSENIIMICSYKLLLLTHDNMYMT
jgi:hypothetical protein